MPWYDIIWNYEPGGNVDHVAEHGLTPDEVVVYEEIDDVTVYPVTAYEV